ncbi:hypothetical protein V8C86DRAFT_2465486 [Haematococcus lacustris]
MNVLRCPIVRSSFASTTRQASSHVAPASGRQPDGLLISALEKALQQISRLLQDQERKLKQRPGSLQPQSSKLVKFSAKAAAERVIKEPEPGCLARGRGVDSYIALPLDQYALLDPRWISRPDMQAAPDVFLLKVPLQQLMSVDLQPEVYVRVAIDPQHSRVRFLVDRLKVGHPGFDSDFDCDMEAVLQHRPLPDPEASWHRRLSTAMFQKPAAPSLKATAGNPVKPSRHHGHASISTSLTVPNDTSIQAVPNPSSSSSSDNSYSDHSSTSSSSKVAQAQLPQPPSASSLEAHQADQEIAAAPGPPAAALDAGTLSCSVDVSFQVRLPAPLSVAPGPLLALAAGLVAKLALQSLLPPFLDLLAVDYGRWATGRGSRADAAGSLLAAGDPPSSTGQEPGVGSRSDLGGQAASLTVSMHGARLVAHDEHQAGGEVVEPVLQASLATATAVVTPLAKQQQ